MRESVILVDGANAYAAAKQLGFQIDYKKVLESYDEPVRKGFFFTALKQDEKTPSLVRPLVDFLSYNQWTVISKPMSEWWDPATERMKLKGNMDTEIAITAVEMAMLGFDLVLFSGDGDFRYMVEYVQRRYGCRVTVVSTIETRPAMCADALRRQADRFLDLSKIRDNIEKERR